MKERSLDGSIVMIEKNRGKKLAYDNKCLFAFIMLMGFLISILTACEVEETENKKIKDLDYTICDESKLPDELVKLIHERRKEPFRLTYHTKDYLYIVEGYGAQDRADLCIQLKELYLTENAIFVETTLNALEGKMLEEGKLSYPWIAVKCPLYDVQVIFQ